MKKNILLVEDEIYQAEPLIGFLTKNGYNVKNTQTISNSINEIKNKNYDLIISDYRLKDGNSEEILNFLRKNNIKTPLIVITAFGNIQLAVTMMQKGAFTFIEKPINLSNLLENIKKAIEHKRLIQENEILKENIKEDKIIYKSHIMEQILKLAKKSAQTSTTVLITGENGTGKELIAKFIHNNSNRKHLPMVTVNCSALSSSLLESELFGHVKGAFTGANTTRIGRFEQANGSTIFLDEIGEISPEIQIKLLRVLQEKQIERVGSNTPINVDIRIIAATNKDLLQLIKENKFREDLYYRLNVINIHLPPLRERKEDIPELVNFFINKFNSIHNKKINTITDKALEKLINYNFPGNIRELQNIIERSFIITDKNYIDENDIILTNQVNNAIEIEDNLPLAEKLQQIEKTEIIKTLSRFNGNQTKTANFLGLSERVLRYKLKKYNINSSNFKK